VLKASLRPLYAATTWRRWTYMLLGGMVAVPYLIVAVAAGGAVSGVGGPASEANLLPLAVLFAVMALGLFLTGLLPVARRLECSISLEMLGAPEQPGRDTRRSARMRAALWFAVHTMGGAAVGLLSLVVPLLSCVAFSLPFQTPPDGGPMSGLPRGWEALWLIPLGALPLLGLVYGVALLGRLAARGAAWALGPSPEERIAAAERRADAQAERTRLARELHDSVGHALSVVTLQAAAAGRVLDRGSDGAPQTARSALAAIEQSARAALADLDHVLGLLRDDDAAPRTAGDPSDGRPTAGDPSDSPRTAGDPSDSPRTAGDPSGGTRPARPGALTTGAAERRRRLWTTSATSSPPRALPWTSRWATCRRCRPWCPARRTGSFRRPSPTPSSTAPTAPSA
jgi:hypothetical protein